MNDSVSLKDSSNLDIVSRLSRDLENEGVVISNAKILKIILALRTVIKVYYKVYAKASALSADPSAEINERFTY